jgi:structural maintenance of chromosome 4
MIGCYHLLRELLQETQVLVKDLREKATSSRQKAEEAKASQAASTSQNKVLESLTRLQNTGRISGFHVGFQPFRYD